MRTYDTMADFVECEFPAPPRDAWVTSATLGIACDERPPAEPKTYAVNGRTLHAESPDVWEPDGPGRWVARYR